MTKFMHIWDLPIRLFHWFLVSLLIFSYVSGKIGGAWLEWHMKSGLAIIALLIFRFFWGIAGSSNARFASFIHGPGRVYRHLYSLIKDGNKEYAGHNPAGGWMVVLLLVLTTIQAVSGLFTDDDISTRGPLAAKVADETVAFMSHLHALNLDVLLLAVAVHVATILFYLFIKKDNLLAPLFHGKKRFRNHAVDLTPPYHRSSLRAMLFMMIAGAAVYWLTKL